MPWNDNKQPVHFEDWKPYSLLGKRGWLFKHGLADAERVAIPSYQLARLLKEEKAFLVIDKDAWAKLVERYRGVPPKPAHAPQAKPTQPSPLQLQLEDEARKLAGEYQRLTKEIAQKTDEAHKNLKKDPTKAARLSLELRELHARQNKLVEDARKLKGQLGKK